MTNRTSTDLVSQPEVDVTDILNGGQHGTNRTLHVATATAVQLVSPDSGFEGAMLARKPGVGGYDVGVTEIGHASGSNTLLADNVDLVNAARIDVLDSFRRESKLLQDLFQVHADGGVGGGADCRERNELSCVLKCIHSVKPSASFRFGGLRSREAVEELRCVNRFCSRFIRHRGEPMASSLGIRTGSASDRTCILQLHLDAKPSLRGVDA